MSSSSARPHRRAARPGRIVLACVLVLVAAIVSVLWVLPGMLDWNKYRGSIASLLAAGLGRPVEIQGNITLNLLPQPILTASGLKIGDNGDGVAMAIHDVRLRVAIGPLLGGRIDARELVLHGAYVILPWPPPPAALARRPPAWLTGLQARVEEGRLQIGNFIIDEIDASLGSDIDTGTLSAAGSAKVLGHPWHITARLGRPGSDGAAPLDVSLDGQERLRDAGGTFSGSLAGDGTLNGRVVARGPDLSQILPAPALAWRADGRLSASGGLAVADELALDLGGVPAKGAVAVRVDPTVRLDLAVAAGRLDLNAWLPALLRTAQAGAPNFPTGVDVSTEAATLAGGMLRKVRLALDIDATGVSVREASALLPGDASTSVQGRFDRDGAFNGMLRLKAPDLPATLRWLAPLAPSVLGAIPENAVHAADIRARVALDQAQFSLTELKGTLDGALAEGGFAFRNGKRPSVTAGLSLDRLHLDPWLPSALAETDWLSALREARSRLVALGFDWDIKLQAQKALWRGSAFGPLSIDSQTEAGKLTVRRLDASADGLHLTVSGVVGSDGRISEGRVEANTPDLAALRDQLPPNLPVGRGLMQGPANLLLLLSGPPEALAVRATADLGDLHVELEPTINVATGRYTCAVALHHPGAPRLLQRLGMPDPVAWLGDGSFSILAQLAGQPGQLDISTLDVIAGEFHGSGKVSLADRAVTGTLTVDHLTLPAISFRSADPLPFEFLRLGDAKLHLTAGEVLVGLSPILKNAQMDIAVTGGALALAIPAASLGGGTVTGHATITQTDGSRFSTDLTLSNVALVGPLTGAAYDVTGGILAGKLSLTAAGHSPATLLATLAGEGNLTVRDAIVTGLDLPAIEAAFAQPPTGSALSEQLKAALAQGTTRLPELSIPFELRRGTTSFRAQGASDSLSVALDASVDLLAQTIDGRLTVQPGAELPELVDILTGALRQPTRTPELAAVARWLAERPAPTPPQPTPP